MAMTRIEKALTMPLTGIPRFFEHSPTPNKPTPPSAAGLGTEDLQRYQIWVASRENGAHLGMETMNASAALKAQMALFEAYLVTSGYKAWAAVDVAAREMQWRLMLVDVGEAVNAKATIPLSQDATGAGTAGPLVGDIGTLGFGDRQITPQVVTTGDVNAPELIFGDDGDVVTTE